MDSDLDSSNHDLTIDFNSFSDVSLLQEPQLPLPVWKDFKAFQLDHYRKISDFFLRPPTPSSVQILLQHHPTVPRDGKPRTLQQYFVGLIQERCGTPATSFSADAYTKEALHSEFPPTTTDLSSVCTNCHQIHSTPAAPSTVSNKSNRPIIAAKRTRKKYATKKIPLAEILDVEEDSDEALSDSDQEPPPTTRVMRSSTATKNVAGIKDKKRRRNNKVEDEDVEAPVTTKKSKIASGAAKPSTGSSAPPKTESTSSEESLRQPNCTSCPLGDWEHLTAEEIWTSDCTCFSRLHLQCATEKDLRKLIKQLKGACEANYKKLEVPFRDWAVALVKPKTAAASVSKKLNTDIITGYSPRVLFASATTPVSPYNPSSSTQSSNHSSPSSIRHMIPGGSNSKKAHFNSSINAVSGPRDLIGASNFYQSVDVTLNMCVEYGRNVVAAMARDEVEMTLSRPGSMIAIMLANLTELMDICTTAKEQLMQAKLRMAETRLAENRMAEASATPLGSSTGGISREGFLAWIRRHHPTSEPENIEKWFKVCSQMQFDVDFLDLDSKYSNAELLATASQGNNPVTALMLKRMLQALGYV